MITARTNPFATARSEALLPYDPAWIGTTWERLFERLDDLRWRAAVVGPHGSGKTTFLDALADTMRARGVRVAPFFLNRQSGPATAALNEFLAALDATSVILLDGTEQLTWWAWNRFLRRTGHGRGLIVTAHRGGRLPTLLETRVTPGILRRCIHRLDPHFAIDARGAERLFHRHDGNIRHALLECYDRAGQREQGVDG